LTGGIALCWGGDVRTLSDDVARGPRLWGNCSGLARLCVRSNNPHLLQSCDSTKRRYGRGVQYTNHLARVQAGSPPGGRICSAAVKTPPADPVVQFSCGIVRVYGVERLLHGIVARDLMSTTGYLCWHYMCGGKICCSTRRAFMGWWIVNFCSCLDTIK
jgi:hypothetical protein